LLVKMLTNAASPAFVLEAGKVYNLPKALAQQFLRKTKHPVGRHPVTREEEFTEHGPFAVTVPAGTKATRLPPQPDPEDVPEFPEDDVAELDDED
jgi:hypothetical protein